MLVIRNKAAHPKLRLTCCFQSAYPILRKTEAFISKTGNNLCVGFQWIIRDPTTSSACYQRVVQINRDQSRLCAAYKHLIAADFMILFNNLFVDAQHPTKTTSKFYPGMIDHVGGPHQPRLRRDHDTVRLSFEASQRATKASSVVISGMLDVSWGPLAFIVSLASVIGFQYYL